MVSTGAPQFPMFLAHHLQLLVVHPYTPHYILGHVRSEIFIQHLTQLVMFPLPTNADTTYTIGSTLKFLKLTQRWRAGPSSWLCWSFSPVSSFATGPQQLQLFL